MANQEAQPVTAIEIDPQENDADSALDERLTAYTTSLSSSVFDYPVEHGRTYHSFRAGSYQLPNDEREMGRLDLTHYMTFRALGDKLFLAPVDNDKVHRVLDIGTGTGIWAIDVAETFPAAEIIGNDLSPIQPQWYPVDPLPPPSTTPTNNTPRVPPNVKFEIDDVESPWAHPAPFDYIFCRYMVACIASWPRLIQSIHDNLRPGGWAEFQDYNFQFYSTDGTLSPTSPAYTWATKLLSLADRIGRTASPGPHLEAWVHAAGFQNVTVKKLPIPVGPWPKDPVLKEVGTCNLIQMLNGLEAFSMRLLCDADGWSEEQVHAFLTEVRKDLKRPGVHAQYDMYVVCGQRAE
ncbi:S-adenosyl-L-methionine-dependent methyltransferase [Podospora aff. communis PSN243]|uniref:S-adenosyl-L-methionine-dependent methyltransferase n=1 Tax=Podospora aff. communis PSN243 TaxID=3040156 RepID=A0AAV9G496_9PEZI|nr:S-adenosyl-L-methionine-dependent methyltransferase [Podospora aff. communis PSN243]